MSRDPFASPSLVDKAIAAGLWGAGLSWLVPMLGSLTVLHHVVEPDRIDRLTRLYCRGQVALTGSKWSAVVHPAVDPKGVYVFAQNHVNHFDHVTMYDATPHFKQGIELESHFDYPFYGWFMKSRGTIPVAKKLTRQLKSIRDGMQREVEKGHSILVFPEGTRTLDGQVGVFQPGVFRVARDLGIPVVPVAVTGMYGVMRKGSWIIRPGQHVTVYVEEPIPTAGLSNGEVKELTERVRAIVAARLRTAASQESSAS